MKNRMKTLMAVLCLVGSTARAEVSQKPIHHIVWIHGIGGNASQAGFMKESLEKYLPTQDNSEDFKVSYFDYKTQDDTLTIKDFEKDFDQYLQKKFLKETPLGKNDRISIIAHSQGGLITMMWLGDSCFDKGNPSFAICSKIKTLTTLGTPFWGSRLANMAEVLKKWIGNTGIMKDYGIKQLAALSVASPAVFEHKIMMERRGQQFYNLFNKQIRLMVVAGRSSVFDSLKPLFAGEGMEDDLGVPVTSSNPSYYRYSGHILDGQTQTRTDVIVPFRYQYAIVDAVHIPQLPNLIRDSVGEAAVKWIPNINYPSLIDIPEDCVHKSLEVCSSPTIKYVAYNILGQQKKIQNRMLTAFAIQIRLRASKDVEANKYLSFKISQANESSEVGKWTEPYSNFKQVVGETVYGYVTGSQVMKNSLQQVPGRVNLEIYFGSQVIHKTLLKVTPGISTFVDLKVDEVALQKLYSKILEDQQTFFNPETGTEVR